MKRVLQVVVVISSVSLGSLSPAAVITVDLLGGGEYTDIQPAIDAAQEGDTVLVKEGEYVITESINFKGKAITVRGERCAGETTIRMGDVAAAWSGVVVFENGENEASILEGFTLTAGSEWGDPCHPTHGVSCSRNSSPTLRDCKVTRNSRGGVYCSENSSPTFLNCAITANIAIAAGGVYCSSPP